jgi:hypothetical protein
MIWLSITTSYTNYETAKLRPKNKTLFFNEKFSGFLVVVNKFDTWWEFRLKQTIFYQIAQETNQSD